MSRKYTAYRDVRPDNIPEVSFVFGLQTEDGLKVGMNCLLGNCLMLNGDDASELQASALAGLSSFATSDEFVDVTPQILKLFVEKGKWRFWLRRQPAKAPAAEKALPAGASIPFANGQTVTVIGKKQQVAASTAANNQQQTAASTATEDEDDLPPF